MCGKLHGTIWEIHEKPEIEPEVHDRCRCQIRIMSTVKAGTATTKALDGADWTLKHESKLPDYYMLVLLLVANKNFSMFLFQEIVTTIVLHYILAV